MRRCSVLLLLFLTGSVLSASAAHAEPICARVWTEGTVVPEAEVWPKCTPYDYGVTCAYDHYWVDPEAHVHAAYCYPRPF